MSRSFTVIVLAAFLGLFGAIAIKSSIDPVQRVEVRECAT